MNNKASSIMRGKDIAFAAVFGSPEGKQVLEDLTLRFVPEALTTKDQHSTTVRAAQADVIRYIERRIVDGMAGKFTG
jgi:hypothetical protein